MFSDISEEQAISTFREENYFFGMLLRNTGEQLPD
jgi:hypothetical protein